jgi:hypothetical protein
VNFAPNLDAPPNLDAKCTHTGKNSPLDVPAARFVEFFLPWLASQPGEGVGDP